MTSLDDTTEKAYNATAGQVIVGNLMRGNDGKFTSAGKPAAPRYAKFSNPKIRPIPKVGGGKGKAGSGKKGSASPRRADVAQKLAVRKQRLADQAKKKAEREAEKKKREQEQADKKAQRAVEQATKKIERDAKAKQREQDRAKKKAEIEQRRLQKQIEAQNKPKGGGSGGKAKPDKAAEQRRNQAMVQTKTLPKDQFDAFQQLARGETADTKTLDALATIGLVERDVSGAYRLSSAGRSYLNAANSGDVGKANDALSRARDRVARRNELRAKKKKVTTKERNSLTVVKQANGQSRWILVSSTAFQDRDGHIIETAALQNDCDYADTTKDYGTLNWWHTPIVLGDCDFNMVLGRSLIESGTFRHERYAPLFAQSTKALRASIGFRHPLDQPHDGRFSLIRRFERSLLPAGRESNIFTRLFIQGVPMATQAEKLKELSNLVGDDDALLDSLLATVKQTEADAEAMGMQWKEATAEAEPDAGDPQEDGESDSDELLFSDAEISALAAALAEKLVPLLQATTAKEVADLTVVHANIAELEQSLTTVKQASDDGLRAINQTLTTLKQQLDDLNGVQPAAKPYRATQDDATKTTKDYAPPQGVDPNFLTFVMGQ